MAKKTNHQPGEAPQLGDVIHYRRAGETRAAIVSRTRPKAPLEPNIFVLERDGWKLVERAKPAEGDGDGWLVPA